MLVKSATYTGTGSSLPVTGVGFAPDVVLVKGAANWAIIHTSSMAADAGKFFANAAIAFQTDYITALGLDGFTLGTSSVTNANGVTYHYLALKADAANLKVGSFTGSGSGQAITGVGFQPTAVFTIPAAARPIYLKTSDMASTNSIFTGDGGFLVGSHITVLGADGFTVGADTDVDESGQTIHYLALKDEAGVFSVFTYTGNGTDNRSVGSVGFTPDFAMVKGDGSTSPSPPTARFKSEVGDNSFLLNNTAEAANQIQAFVSGGIQVGTDVSVNENTKGYYGLAFKEAAGGGGVTTRRYSLTTLGVG